VTRGIGVSDAAGGTQGLPNVNPVYTWVRLAQRVPVRIAIDSVPPGIPLVSGMTATITIKDASDVDGTWLARAIEAVESRVSDVLDGPPARDAFPRPRLTKQPRSLFLRTRQHQRPPQSSSIRGSRPA